MDRRIFGVLGAAILLVAWVGVPALGAGGFGEDDPNEEEVDQRERTVGRNYPLEKELETDRSIETWLYVFSALMLLCIGWLCFKPTRVYAGKSGKKVVPTKGPPKGKKPKK